jgi:flagellar biosynthesis protein FlhF
MSVQLRRFKGKALPEVVAQVRAELGPEAVILHTKEGRGFSRFLHGRSVEVVAAVDERARVRARAAGAARPEPAAEQKPAWTTPPSPPQPSPLEPIKAEIAELRRLLLRFGGARGLPSTMAPVYSWLVNAGVDEPLAFRLLDEIPVTDANGPLSIEALTAAVERRAAGLLRVAGAAPTLTKGTIAFVGPTGAGKSSTLAKLAVRAHVEGITPCVVSLDASCAAPATPLEAISRVVGITHEIATTPAQVRTALERQTPLKLIDTPGLGPLDHAGIAALAPLLHAARPSEVHFVMPATMKTDDALATLAAFGPLWVTRVAFTKLDEASTFGSILGVAAESALPVSYIAAGREVPDDLHPATAAELARRVLRRERP